MLVHLIDFKIYSEYKCRDVGVLFKVFSKNPAKKENVLSLLDTYVHLEKKSLFVIPTQTRLQNTSKRVIFIFIIVFFS